MILRILGWNGQAAHMREKRGIYRVLVRKPEGKTSLERFRRRWEDNVKMHFQEVECGVWTGSSWLRIGRVGGHL